MRDLCRAAALLLAAAAPAQAGGELLHPLEPGARVTSTFGEYRSGHYHGGLDFSTGGSGGMPVRAPGSGWVLRLRASGVGYGRAAYLRLDDGRTVVLAHLSRWRDDIDRAVRRRQLELGRYEIDWHPEPGSMSFSAGEIVAYTGASGAGPPHLHVEVRTGPEADLAVNPLEFGWGAPDSTAPRLEGVRWESRPRGAPPRVVDPADPDARLVTGGPGRLWVKAYDRSDQGGRLGLVSLEVRLNGEVVQHIGFHAFNWADPDDVEWVYYEALARELNERWICLDAPPGSPHGMYRESAVPTPEPGVHVLEIRALDQAGLTAEARIMWQVESPAGDHPGPEGFEVSPRGEAELRVPGAYLKLPPGSLYESEVVELLVGDKPVSGGKGGELVPVSAALRLEPWGLPLRRRVEVGLMWPHYDPRVAVYSRRGEEWVFEGAEPVLGGLRTGIRNLEELALFRDETPPRISLRRPGPGANAPLKARIVENGAGVTWRTIRMELDGHEVIAEWDPESRFLTGYPLRPLSRGEHRLTVIAADRSGNEAREELWFEVR